VRATDREYRIPTRLLSAKDLYQCRRSLVDFGDPQGVLELAAFCRERKLSREAEKLLEQAMQVNPEAYREAYLGAIRETARPVEEKKAGEVFAAVEVPKADPAALPTIFWHSQPIRPGQTLMLSGANFDASAIVELARLPDDDPSSPTTFQPNDSALSWMRLKPLQVTAHTLSVVLPGGSQAVYACRVRVGNNVGPARLVNAPEPWFVQGDLGETASPKGWVGVFGTCIDLSGSHASTDKNGTEGAATQKTPSAAKRNGPVPKIALCVGGRAVKTFDARTTDGTHYGQFFDLDGRMTGVFEVYVHNGYGGRMAWIRYEGMTSNGRALAGIAIAPPPVWPDRAVNVTEEKGGSDDERFASAVKRCSGGGVLLVPAGTYTLTRTLELPDRTVLKGAGRDTTLLRWTKEPSGGDKKGALVKGRNFSVEDLTLENAAGDACRGIQTHNGAEPRRIHNVRIKARNAAAHFKDAAEGLFMGGTRNLAVTHCDIDARIGITLHGWEGGPNQFVRFEHNTIRWRSDSFRPIFSNSQLIFRANRTVMAGTFMGNGYTVEMNPNPGDWFGTWGFNARDLYYAENESAREEQEPPHGCIGLTFDGGQGVYWGKVVSTNGTTMILASPTATPEGIRGSCDRGALVSIVHGRGTGQWRHLLSPATRQGDKPGTTITIDRPWDIVPDGSSWIAISDFQGRTLYVGNAFGNHPLIQTYFGTHDIVYAENRIGVPGKAVTVPVWVGDRRGGMANGWHYQVLDNLIGHLGATFTTSVNSKDLPAGYDGFLTGMHVYRGNAAVDANAKFTLRFPTLTEGWLVEDNRGVAEFGAREVKGTTGIVRGNSNPKGAPLLPPAPAPEVLVVK